MSYIQKSYIRQFGNKQNFMETNIVEDITHLVDQSNSGGNGVQTITGLDTDNTDPQNPVINIAVDGVTIQGQGTALNPLEVVPGSGGTDILQPVNSNFVPQGTNMNSTAYLSYGINVVTNLTTVNDYACHLPNPPQQGKRVTIVNTSGFTIYVYPSVSGGTIDGIVNFGFPVPSNSKAYEFVCYENPNPGDWAAITSPGANGIRVLDVTYPAFNETDPAAAIVFSFIGEGTNTNKYSTKNICGSLMAIQSANPQGVGIPLKTACPDDNQSCDLSTYPPEQSYIYNSDNNPAIRRPNGALAWFPFLFLTPSVRRVTKIKLYTNSQMAYVEPPNTGASMFLNTSSATDFFTTTTPQYQVTGVGPYGDPYNTINYVVPVPTNGFPNVNDNNPPINNQYGYASETVGLLPGTFVPVPNVNPNLPNIARTSANAGDPGTWYWEAVIPQDWAGGRFDYVGKTLIGYTTSLPTLPPYNAPGGDSIEVWYFRCLNMKLRLPATSYPDIPGVGYRPFNDMKFKLVFEVEEL